MRQLKSLRAIMVAVLVVGVMGVVEARAQKGPVNTLSSLPQDHEYQKALRSYMATLTAKDFDHGVTEKIPTDKPTSADPEYLYRQYIYTLWHQPLVGSKRGVPAITTPADQYVLSSFETDQGVLFPQVWPETLISFVQWDHPGNHYRNSRALKLRAFVGAATYMMMFHKFAELNDTKMPPPIRPDWQGYNPVFFAAPYPGFKDVLPPEVQKAYEAGLKMVGQRMLAWGIRGESCETDLKSPLGLVYISRAINDPEFTSAVEACVRMVCTDPKYFHPAGFWVERGGIDTGFAGQANLYAAWIALMTDWPFAKEAIEKTYRLRGHLLLPEPDGSLVGPSHFNARLGSPANADQFDLRVEGPASDSARDVAAAMVSDEAAQFVTTPTPETLKASPGHRAHGFDFVIGENPRITEDGKQRHLRNEEIKNSQPWKLRQWWTYNFPISVNPAYEFYRKGTFAYRQELGKKNSPLLKSPYLRGESFIRNFDNAFVAVRQPAFAALLHTGPVGSQSPDDSKAQFGGPLGMGGGQLSAFWTPATGSVILGMRSGMSYDKTYDELSDWRLWPSHAVSGVTVGGKVFTSARIVRPEVATEIKTSAGTIQVGGVVPALKIVTTPAVEKQKEQRFCYDEALDGRLEYTRTFTIDDKGVSIQTTVTGDGKDTIAELYETIPVYLRNPKHQPDATPTAIAFQIGGKWTPATDQYAADVSAVRLTRLDGSVLVTFDTPRRAKLSPADWAGTWMNSAACRNVMIDLLASGDKPATVKGEKKIAYRIEPSAK